MFVLASMITVIWALAKIFGFYRGPWWKVFAFMYLYVAIAVILIILAMVIAS